MNLLDIIKAFSYKNVESYKKFTNYWALRLHIGICRDGVMKRYVFPRKFIQLPGNGQLIHLLKRGDRI